LESVGAETALDGDVTSLTGRLAETAFAVPAGLLDDNALTRAVLVPSNAVCAALARSFRTEMTPVLVDGALAVSGDDVEGRDPVVVDWPVAAETVFVFSNDGFAWTADSPFGLKLLALAVDCPAFDEPSLDEGDDELLLGPSAACATPEPTVSAAAPTPRVIAPAPSQA
jgi:hypothetical protein